MRVSAFVGLAALWATSVSAAVVTLPSTSFSSKTSASSPSSSSTSTSSPSSSSTSTRVSSSSISSSTTSKVDILSSVVSKASSYASAANSVVSTVISPSACAGNSPSTRSQWCQYNVSTNYYDVVPDTGVVREYWFNLEQVTVAPDGVSRMALTVNGTVPGPTIIGNWGDTIKVHVTNNLAESHNGTSIHFHGIRQNYTNQHDGVVSVTQCPTAPGNTYTYTWKATQYGTSWYHSHFALQAWEGVFGGILINGPTTANYDIDMGHIFLNDWSHQTVDEMYSYVQQHGAATLDTGLINGTNVYGEDGSSTQTGSRFAVSVVPGASYRLRLVSGAVETHFKFMIDNHTMTVVSADFVPIEPYKTNVLNIGMGQRYDVIVTMDQGAVATDFWMRAIPMQACSENDNYDNIKGIVHYSGGSNGLPQTSGFNYTDECVDEAASNLVPYLALDAGASSLTNEEDVFVNFNSDRLFRWTLNTVSLEIEWDNPTVLQIYNNDTTWSDTSNVIELDVADEWYYLVIETYIPVPHPIHLHGHDFFLLSQGSGAFDYKTYQTSNPPRRDVALLPANGHLVFAFKTDNPGAWLCHCHIGFHTSEGFALQFVERKSEIPALLDVGVLESNCNAWDSYMQSNAVTQDDDSGV